MRDWTRYEEAKSLRESGLTLKQVGEALGVSAGRAKQMLEDLRRHAGQVAREKEDTRLVKWGQNLNPSTRARLESAARELIEYGWKVVPPGAWSSGEPPND